MKRSLQAIGLLSLMLFCSVAHAEIKMELVNEIPERYALLRMTGFDPNVPLDKDKILKIFEDEFNKHNYVWMQFVVYDEGKKPGEGARAIGEKTRLTDIEIKPFFESEDKNKSLLMEDYLAYEISPKELYNAYNENEVAADDDFNGKPILIQHIVDRVKKDVLGTPYISIPITKYGMNGVNIYFKKSDSLVRKIKRGHKVIIRGYAKSFTMGSVVVHGEILSIRKK